MLVSYRVQRSSLFGGALLAFALVFTSSAAALDTCMNYEATISGAIDFRLEEAGLPGLEVGSSVIGSASWDDDSEGDRTGDSERYNDPRLLISLDFGGGMTAVGRVQVDRRFGSSAWVTNSQPGMGDDRVILDAVSWLDPDDPAAEPLLVHIEFSDPTGTLLSRTDLPSSAVLARFPETSLSVRTLPGDERSVLFLAHVGTLDDCGLPNTTFRRGDVNDDGALDMTDPVRIFEFLFLGASRPGCHRTADTNDNGTIDLSDGVYALNYLFSGGPAIRAPFPACGTDETTDVLDCDQFQSCGTQGA
jgi:hypothetical protein